MVVFRFLGRTSNRHDPDSLQRDRVQVDMDQVDRVPGKTRASKEDLPAPAPSAAALSVWTVSVQTLSVRFFPVLPR